MTLFIHGRQGAFYVSGYDLSPCTTGAATDESTALADTSAFGSSATSSIPGLKSATLAGDGLFDNASGAEHATWRTTAGAEGSLWAYMPAGDVIGQDAFCLTGDQSELKTVSAVGDAVRVSFAASSDVGLEGGVVLHAQGAESGAASSASVDNAAATTNGIAGYLFCFAGSGSSSPTMTVKIQHSTDNSSWSDLVTFSTLALGAQPSSQRVTAAGTVNRYLRARVTAVGGTSPTATIWVAGARL